MKILNKLKILSLCFAFFAPVAFATIEVSIEGLKDDEKQAILSSLSIEHSKDEKELTIAQVRNLFQLSEHEIATGLSSFGYYNGSVAGRLKKTDKAWLAHYQVKAGKPTRLEALRVAIQGPGKQDAAIKAALEKNRVPINSVLLHSHYEDLKKGLLNSALEAGYLNAAYETSTIEVNRNTQKAVIVLTLATGPRYYMGKVSFVGSEYPDFYLARYIHFKQDEPYTSQQLVATQQALIESNLFTKVRLIPDVKHHEQLRVPISIRLTPKSKNKYLAGVGYGTDTSFRAHAGWERRRLSHPGHITNFDINVSGVQDKAQVKYHIPGLDPLKDHYEFSLRFTRDVTDRIDPKWYQRANTHHPLGYYSAGWDLGATYVHQYGRFKFDSSLNYLADTFREYLGAPNQRSSFLLPSLSSTWTYSIKDPSFIQKGVRIVIIGRGASKKFLSSTDFAQLELGLKVVYPFANAYRILARVDLGATAAREFKKVPPQLRFLSGGDQSVRGYEASSLGPHEFDKNGKKVIVGGRYQWVNSVELERKITEQIRGAAFVDAGNAMNDWKTPLRMGVGVGVRVGTPLGPFRLDVAHPIKGRGFKPNVTFGWDL